jgi:queuine tRNA-ribosyltransferase
MRFSILATSGAARRGRLELAHGAIDTPAFMPVGTYGSVKAMAPDELVALGAQIVLGNTFHLWLRPGLDVIAAHRGLHRFMGWSRPLLTDSGGFQVYSLGPLRKVQEDGVAFASPINGDRMFLTPELSMEIQRALDSDIAMIFDECTPYPATRDEAARSMELSLRWASRSKVAHADNPNALFGIVQGGMHDDLRDASIADTCRARIRRLRNRRTVGRRAQG